MAAPITPPATAPAAAPEPGLPAAAPRLAYEARVIWQKSPEIGLQFLRSYRFDEVPSAELGKLLKDEG